MVFISYNFPLSRNFSFFCFCISFSNLFSFLQHFYFRIWSLQSAKKYWYTFESFLKIPWGHEVFRVFSRLFLIAAWVYHQKYLYIYIYIHEYDWNSMNWMSKSLFLKMRNPLKHYLLRKVDSFNERTKYFVRKKSRSNSYIKIFKLRATNWQTL